MKYIKTRDALQAFYGYSLFVVGDGQVVVTALRSSLPQVR